MLTRWKRSDTSVALTSSSSSVAAAADEVQPLRILRRGDGEGKEREIYFVNLKDNTRRVIQNGRECFVCFATQVFDAPVVRCSYC